MGYRVSGGGRWYCQRFDYAGEHWGIGSVVDCVSSLTTQGSNGVLGHWWRTVVLSVVRLHGGSYVERGHWGSGQDCGIV